MSLVVSDTSPLRALHFLGVLDVLRSLFGQVYLPPTVIAELANPPPDQPTLDVGTVPWLIVRAPRSSGRIQNAALDAGELDAIALAVELNATFLLIDEQAGRRAAANAGVSTVGVLGVLLRAKRAGLLPAVTPLMHTLRDDLGFFLTEDLIQGIRQDAGEA